jgi:hypothetical protein
MSLAVV